MGIRQLRKHLVSAVPWCKVQSGGDLKICCRLHFWGFLLLLSVEEQPNLVLSERLGILQVEQSKCCGSHQWAASGRGRARGGLTQSAVCSVLGLVKHLTLLNTKGTLGWICRDSGQTLPDKLQQLFYTFPGKYWTVMSRPSRFSFLLSRSCVRALLQGGGRRDSKEECFVLLAFCRSDSRRNLSSLNLVFVPKTSQFMCSSSEQLDFSLQSSEMVGYKQDLDFIQDRGVPA